MNNSTLVETMFVTNWISHHGTTPVYVLNEGASWGSMCMTYGYDENMFI